MILSFLIIIIGGYFTGLLFEKIKLPKIVGMILFGILIGPNILNIISSKVINISSILRQIALIIIISRAGLNLNIKNIKEMGLNALLLSFIPATFEIIGIALLSYYLLSITFLEGLLLGSVLAAVSPAILVPKMINLKEKGYEKVPNILLVGSSLDDIYVIVLFYMFLNIIKTNKINYINIIQIPTSIILGAILGVLIGLFLYYLLKKVKFNKYLSIFLLLTTTIFLVFSENYLFKVINVSTLISVLTIFITLTIKNKSFSKEINKKYNYLWFLFEILLFVLVGISVDINYALKEGLMPVLVIIIGLIIRSIGTYISLISSNFKMKEKLFIISSYIPKATVQASIGAIALNEGLNVGSLILTISVLAILITAPLGALLIDNTYEVLLSKPIRYNNNKS